MAEEQEDKSGQNQPPTERRKQKAREQGQAPQSRELYHAAVVGGFFAFFWMQGDWFFETNYRNLAIWFQKATLLLVEAGPLWAEIKALLSEIALGLFPFFLWLVVLIVGILGLQTRFRIKKEPFKGGLERLSLFKGVKRIFSTKNLVEFGKNLLRLTLLFGLLGLAFWEQGKTLWVLAGLNPWHLLARTQAILTPLFVALFCGILILSLADYGYAWFQFFKKLMMSPQDIRKELKETEKGPEVRQRQRRFQMDIRQMRQAQEKVPGSTVLITNPTHYAVALLWQPHRMNAPEVVCKGQDRVALYMKTLAREASVPIVEERALAQTLFKTLKVGDAIHPRHYKAVAKVIRYIKRIDARHGGRREESVEG